MKKYRTRLVWRRFDVCLMNPPYARSTHIDFLYKMLDIADTTISIQPNDFMFDVGHYSGWNKDGKLEHILKYTKEIEQVENAKELFNIARLDKIAIFVCTQDESDKWLGSAIWDRTLLDVVEKFYRGKHLLNKCVRNEKAGKYFVKLFKMHFCDDYKHYIDDILVPDGNNNTSYGINFDSEEEMNNFKDSLKCWPYKIMYIMKDNQIAHLPWLDDYTHKWTDDELYKKFNITDKQRKTIEKYIKQDDEQL